MIPTPETSAILDFILERDGELTERNAPAKLVQLAKEAERTRLDVAELNQRLIERAESIVIQASKIDETWRKKLRLADATIASLRAHTPEQDHAAILKACYGFIGSMEITRKALKAIRSALSKGMQHSRKDLEALLPRLETEMQQCKLDHKGPAHINSNIRLFDLVRYSRNDLHHGQLISDEEYFWLCAEAEHATAPEGGSPSRQRLEDYDELRNQLSLLNSQYAAQVETTKIAFKERDTALADYATLETVYEAKCAALRDQEAIFENYRACIIGDLQPFLAAIAAYAEFNGGCGHHPEDCPQEAEECKIVAAFSTAQLTFFRKHPTLHFRPSKSSMPATP